MLEFHKLGFLILVEQWGGTVVENTLKMIVGRHMGVKAGRAKHVECMFTVPEEATPKMEREKWI